MVIFDQLRLSDNAQKMYVNVHVNEADYFENIYLDRIVIVTSDKVLEATTADSYPEDSEGNPVDYIYTKQFDGNLKEAALVLTSNDFIRTYEEEVEKMNFKQADMSKTLFFVYIKCKGVVGASTPCGLDELVTVGVTFDEKLLYQKVMRYAKELAKGCKVPYGFSNFILLWHAFKAAVETGHYVQAIKYWKLMFSEEDYDSSTSKGCGCHG